MTNANGSAPDEQTLQLKAEIREHLAKFSDLDAFLDQAALPFEFYFLNQREYADREGFRVYVKSVLSEYVGYYSLSGWEEKKGKLARITEIVQQYHKLVYFGEKDLEEQRLERVEEGVSFEEQENRPKGLVLRIQTAVKKIF